MTRSALHHAVARATGETLSVVRGRGFSLVEPRQRNIGCDCGDYCLDCPGCGRVVPVLSAADPRLPELAECPTCDAAYPFDTHELYEEPLPLAS